ncbi:MAG: LEA type 2 family protein [Candidatus Eisenbacteria bacterium]|uniref:LEA type 2 family protein n=1 Tax=Eiseniibacteriota bacterium TaxID=2212470 RepID=A0A956NAQ9_UNCEI|nr:LEA type 2 family protein [Candidatus Eisenbacteria bacterium]MCB9464767.1 LEA type 2 family protein [Candidatus Eisenbacteria bacterium]
MRRWGTGLLALSLVVLAGCAALQKSVTYPKASVQSVDVQDIGFTALTLAFDVAVTNPYSVNLPVLGLDFALNSSGTQFLSGAVDVQEIIPAGETRSLGVPIRVPYKELYDVITGIEAGSKVPYEADMELHVDAPLLGRIGVPLDAKGEISIPRL